MSAGDGEGHLDWILGSLRNRNNDAAAFDTELAELVVLWLEDLAAELNAAPGALAGATVAERQLAAAELQAATRAFAAAVLGAPRGARAS